MHCFSCGLKGSIFGHFGVISNFTSIKVALLKEKLRALHVQNNDVEFPDEVVEYSRSIRGISLKTLKRFEAFYTTSANDKLADRIFFPIRDITGKIKAYAGRHTLSSGNPKYYNYPSGVPLPVFPEIFEEKHAAVVLVEGLFDMLNVYDKGVLNVCCTFGTNTLHKDTASKLMSLKAQGVVRVYIMYDADSAGKTAAAKLKPLIEACGYYVELIDLPENTDPGDMSQESVTELKEYISGHHGNS